MIKKPDFLVQGEPPRLFPVLADSSKEGRVLSIFLSCFENVFEFQKALLSDVGVKAHSRTKIETYTEVVLKKAGSKPLRPDGLIIVTSPTQTWRALVEAKVGAAELTAEQIEAYLELAKLNGIDALITVSNQFAPLPSHYPVTISQNAAKKAKLYHWSWTYLLTQAGLQLDNNQVEDREQRFILGELTRFLSHGASGVQSFDQMPPAWSDLVAMVQAGSPIMPRSLEVQESIGAWYQETQDLCSVLTRQRKAQVTLKVSKAHVSDPYERMRTDAEKLCADKTIASTFQVPGAASPVVVIGDFGKRSLLFTMSLAAPGDRKTTRAKVAWLLKQLEKSKPDNAYVRLFWQRGAPYSQHSLETLRATPEVAEQEGKVLTSFDIVYLRDLGPRFGQRKSFIIELELHFPLFYEQIGQYLRAWTPPVPKKFEATIDGIAVSGTIAVANTVEDDARAEVEQAQLVIEPPEERFDFLDGVELPDDKMSVLLRLRDAINVGAMPPITKKRTADKIRAFRMGPLLRLQSKELVF